MCRKIVGARYYLSGYEAEEETEKFISYRSPRDSFGHGSHTASTAAGRYVNNMEFNGLGSGGARGGAPMARIAVYKTCWDSACYDVDILAAFDDAIKDGVSVVSLSLGSDELQPDYFNDAISMGSFHAVSHGIAVVASVGNNGDPGMATNVAPWIITVGATSTDRDFTSDVILGNGALLSVILLTSLYISEILCQTIFKSFIVLHQNSLNLDRTGSRGFCASYVYREGCSCINYPRLALYVL